MKELKERLEEKIKDTSKNNYIDFCVGYNDPDNKEFEAIYKLGAASLVPLVVELAEAIEFMTMPITSKEQTVESLLETFANDTERGKKALRAIEKFIGETK